MTPEEKYSRLVAKLIAQSYAGSLKWELARGPDMDGRADELSSAVYEITLNNVCFRVRQVTSRRGKDIAEMASQMAAEAETDLTKLMSQPRRYWERRYWERRTILDMIDPESDRTIDSIADIDRHPTLKNLFDAASRSASPLPARIDEILKEDMKHAE